MQLSQLLSQCNKKQMTYLQSKIVDNPLNSTRSLSMLFRILLEMNDMCSGDQYFECLHIIKYERPPLISPQKPRILPLFLKRNLI